MVNQIAIIVTIAAIMISIPIIYFPVFQAQGAPEGSSPCSNCHSLPYPPLPDQGVYRSQYNYGNPAGANMTTGPKHYMIGNPAGANTTSTSNMTGAAGNTTGSNTTGAAGSSIPTTKPAGCSFLDPRC